MTSLAEAGADVGLVTRLVAEAERANPDARTVVVGLSGNVTLDLLGTFLRKHAALRGLRLETRIGPVADRVGGVAGLAAEGVDALVILDLLDALAPGLEARLELGEEGLLAARLDAYRAELELALAAAAAVPTVLVGTLHAMRPPAADPRRAALAEAVRAFNEVLAATAARHPNVGVIDTAAICAAAGWDRAHDPRSYRRFLAPFGPAFHDGLARQVALRTRGFGSYYYKALILDCDGTLWGGTVGEDLLGGIALGPGHAPGSVFWEVQHQLLGLQRRGVLLGLCSRNNEADVAEVFAHHPHMVLRDEHIAIRRVSWDAKADSLRDIAASLGIGLDALVFLDDSPFELEAVRARLPEVATVAVPADISAYPALLDELRDLFAVESLTPGSAAKTAQYRARELALAERGRFESQDAYLGSLGIRVTIRRDDTGAARRIAELTQKSNQFNLTTVRRTEAQVLELMASEEASVYSLSVEDRFGDAGLTGVAVVTLDPGGDATVDSFLLSCRILGRGIEDAAWPVLLDDLAGRGHTPVHASYLPTAKNAQVREYWDRVGFRLEGEDPEGRRRYSLALPAPRGAVPPYVEVIRAW